MNLFSAVAEAIRGASKKTEKVRLLSEYFCSRSVEEAAVSAVFFSGRAFPAWEETTLQAGGSLLTRVILELSAAAVEAPEKGLEAAYRRTGDLGAAACELLQAGVRAPAAPLNILEAARIFREIAAARNAGAKAAHLRQLLERASPLESKYLIKIITGDLRIGLKASLVEEAIAVAYQAPAGEVQRANMLLGDLAETVRLAAVRSLATARMRLFHPLGFMLASPIDSPQAAFDNFPEAQVEDKYDGIRAQAHCGSGEVKIFSRTLDDVTESFPELIDPLRPFEGVIFDGEVVAWDFSLGQALPFASLQKRLGRKRVSTAMMQAVPVAYVIFDILFQGETLTIDWPLRQRRELLDQVVTSESRVLRAAVLRAYSPQELEQFFLNAQARGNEGLMIKDLQSAYTPGRRGRSWLKMKRELATLDVVVTSVEWGHGKRIGVLSDYTFAVRATAAAGNEDAPLTPEGEPLLNIGKAYSGLTDREIQQMTQWFLQHTTRDHGFWREVVPSVVIEVAFNAVMRSERHNSGYALRFPRILRLRPDKLPAQADTLERVREIYEAQKK